MGKLIYAVTGSIDGFINDQQGNYDWAVPGEDLIGFINDQMARTTTYLYGRRMYEEMQGWETDPQVAAQSTESARFAQVWQAADKVVFSTTLQTVPTRRTRLLHEFDPDTVRRIKEASAGDVTVEGPTLAAHALRAGLVDEVHRYIAPAIVGGGVALYPPDLRLDCELLDQQRFDRGMTYLRYAVR